MIKNIIFDFDGVILDSVPIKTESYRKLFHGFPDDYVNQFVIYHELNGGISRYKKVQYFFEEFLNKKISENEILKYANKYSELTKEELSKPEYLIQDTLNFIQKNHQNYNMHIASGADENDLKHICEQLELSKYFISIHGSPTVKSDLVKNILDLHAYQKDETVLIGDSVNDFDAADVHGIEFYGYNNLFLEKKHKYLNTFSNFK